MSLTRQSMRRIEEAGATVVGVSKRWPAGYPLAMHAHARHQLMYSNGGVMHVVTAVGSWILPPQRAIWISAGTEHTLVAKRPIDLINLYVDPRAGGAPAWPGCVVVNVSSLVRELVLACAGLPWDYAPRSRAGRLAQVLLEQLNALPQAPLDLPLPRDPRAVRIMDLLAQEHDDRTPLPALASAAGASARTVERLFRTETRMSFGAWRARRRMILALERLAHGESVGNVAFAVGFGSPSSFVAAFRATFGTTPARFFQDPASALTRSDVTDKARHDGTSEER